MKKLFLLRHSKAGQTNKKILDDHERPLTQKGIDACEFVAEYFNEMDYAPDHIIASSALRAQETATLVARDLKKKSEIHKSQKLYLCSAEDLYKRLALVDDHIENLLVVGHNPGIQQFAMSLAGKGDKKKFREMRSNFPPRGLAVFDIDIESWNKIEPRAGELKNFYIARKTRKAA